MSRRDDINQLYQPSKRLKKICLGLFCVNVGLSILSVFVPDRIISYLTIILIIIAFIYTILSVVDNGLLWFEAEKARRKDSFQNAFGVRLDRYETQGYYNNNIKDYELSYALNIFESIFFTKEISQKMLTRTVIKVIISLIALISTCKLVGNNDVLLIVAQTVFSAVIFEDAFFLIIFAFRIKKLFDEAYHEFITVGISNKEQKVWLKYFCTEYECIKAHYHIRLSESLFDKLNLLLSKEWDSLLKQIKISDQIINEE